MIVFGLDFQSLQFDIAADGGEKVIRLGRRRLRWRTLQTNILFQWFVIFFHPPSFLIAADDVIRQERGITGNQILNSSFAIFVSEDLFD